jgi:hypothetical protein
MTLSQMFSDETPRSFEQRRDVVVSLVEGATDLRGADQLFCGIVDLVRSAATEREFDDAFEVLEWAMSGIPLAVS